MRADVASAIRLGTQGWVYARGMLHFWDEGMPGTACGLDPHTGFGIQEANDWLESQIIVDSVLTPRTVSEVVDIGYKVCGVCAGAWRDEA